jgi:hypothetical protein
MLKFTKQSSNETMDNMCNLKITIKYKNIHPIYLNHAIVRLHDRYRVIPSSSSSHSASVMPPFDPAHPSTADHIITLLSSTSSMASDNEHHTHLQTTSNPNCAIAHSSPALLSAPEKF